MLVLVLKMVVSLAVVLCTFGGAVFLFRKFSGSTKGLLKKARTPAKPMEILAFQSLGAGRGLYLLRCLDKKILVGSTTTQINHISDIVEESDEIEDDFDSSFSDKISASKGESSGNSSDRIGSGLREISRV